MPQGRLTAPRSRQAMAALSAPSRCPISGTGGRPGDSKLRTLAATRSVMRSTEPPHRNDDRCPCFLKRLPLTDHLNIGQDTWTDQRIDESEAACGSANCRNAACCCQDFQLQSRQFFMIDSSLIAYNTISLLLRHYVLLPEACVRATGTQNSRA